MDMYNVMLLNQLHTNIIYTYIQFTYNWDISIQWPQTRGFQVKAGCCGCGLTALRVKKTAELVDVHVSSKSGVRRIL